MAAKGTRDQKYSYGWQRAEILGALINAVFLLALCFSIYLEAIQRFIEPREINQPQLILIVGGAGLCLNIFGLFLFHNQDHGQHHDGAEHDKCSHAKSPTETEKGFYNGHSGSRSSAFSDRCPLTSNLPIHPGDRRRSIVNAGITVQLRSSQVIQKRMSQMTVTDELELFKNAEEVQGEALNMRGVFLHLLGDAAGSIAAMVSALVMWLATSWDTRYVMDPITSCLITTGLMFATIPLIKSASFILLQGTPPHIPLEALSNAMIALPGVLSAHELHVWQLSDTLLVGSVHVLAEKDHSPATILRRVKSVWHQYGIHSSTVQVETWQGEHWMEEITRCTARCVPTCQEKGCCAEDVSVGRKLLKDQFWYPAADRTIEEKVMSS